MRGLFGDDYVSAGREPRNRELVKGEENHTTMRHISEKERRRRVYDEATDIKRRETRCKRRVGTG